MAENENINVNPAEEAPATEAEPKVVYSYVVNRLDNGMYSFEGRVIEGDAPSIDQYHIALDIIDLARKLDKQLTLEEAEARVMNKLAQLAAQPGEEEDPTKA